MQVLTTRASVFGFKHKIIAINGLFSLIAHRKNFIPILLSYEVWLFLLLHTQSPNETIRMMIASNALRVLKLPTVASPSPPHG